MSEKNIISKSLCDPSGTVKINFNEMDKSKLLQMLVYMQSELEAREIVIATLKSEKCKQLLYQAKYGRLNTALTFSKVNSELSDDSNWNNTSKESVFLLGDPFLAMQRDNQYNAPGSQQNNMSVESSIESNLKPVYDSQLNQLENLISSQKKAQMRMKEQIVYLEKKCLKTKESLNKFGETLKRNLVTEKDSFKRINNDLTSIENDKSKLLSSINHLFNEINSILQQRKLELIKDVTKVYEPAVNKLRSLAETKEIDIAVLSSSLQSMDVVKKEGISHGHLLSLYTSIQATLPATTQSYCSKKLVRTGTFLYDIESITNHISTFGELHWSDDTASESPILSRDIPCSSTDMTEKHEASNMIIIDSSINNESARLNREKTFILNRPPRSISYEIPIAQNISIPVTLQSLYQTKSLPIVTFGSKGTGNGEFIWPRGVSVDNDSNKIIVADSSNHRIQIFSDKGVFEKVIANLTCDQPNNDNILLTFDCLSGIAIGKENVIVCSDRYNHRAIVMDSSGRLLHELGKSSSDNAKLSYPWGIAIDSNQNILICDKDNHRIQMFSKTGEYIKEIGSHGRQNGMFDNPHYLAICPKTKNIFVSDTSNHRIQV